ncbi:DUF1852 domain-containing protein [Aurantiacibacter poecillastricola]|uniref:DUF1852 domain-containing protein n=1 Tax=Aurantiacibacter poecillastricola TaxID=3064385 RepID=UPI00273D4753|nr:DUF1852 domain-containing protein [Aurantiacibacter sp. 219JJ12-13]MDP5261165.1 DUF1852 domain-containing protein [Aurantiacibacter sp. 219JJ12-13]
MTRALTFKIRSTRFDEDYTPADNSRLTTNFANLARGPNRKQNLRSALQMIDNRFNALVPWDNPGFDRYGIELDIISVDLDMDGTGQAFPAIEMLQVTILDRPTGTRLEGIVGNNFSSYVRDYDFSVVLPAYNEDRAGFSIPDDFGELHGKVFKTFVSSSAYSAHFRTQPVICLSVSHNTIYRRIANRHPVLGYEYRPDKTSLTEQYFAKMGLQVRYFMPSDSVAPLAFYFRGDILNDYTNLELIGTIATMETFQKIYRPEIYNANSAAGEAYQPSLENPDHSLTRIVYDREERNRLAVEQGRFAEKHFIKHHHARLLEWSAKDAA